MSTYGETLSRAVDARIAASPATQTALGAIPAGLRYDGQLAVVEADQTLWQYVAASSAGSSSGLVIVPADNPSTGRWLCVSGGIAGARTQKATVTITQAADLAGLGAGVKTFDKNLGSALPTNARVLGATIEGVTDFDDATHGTYTIVVGTSAGGNQIGTSMNVAAGQTGFPKAFTAGTGGFPYCPQSGAQLSARITSSVDLNTATAGAATINVFYVVLA